MPQSATLSSPVRRELPRAEPKSRSPHRRSVPRSDANSRAQKQLAARTPEVVPPSDEDLLGRYRDLRNPEDFAELVRRHSAGLLRFLTRYLDDAALAEDVLQDTCILVHTKCSLYQDGWAVRPWLYKVALHRAVDALRLARRLPEARYNPPHAADQAGSLVELLASADPGPFEKLQQKERQQWVRESVAGLPDPLRQTLELAYYQKQSYAEIADTLGIPLGTVRSRLHNAVARLRALADRYDRAGRL
jgi:RNA polymerase sigma-70 factor (ECF subfamily)